MYRLLFFLYITLASNLFGQVDTLYFTAVDSVSKLKFSAVGDLMCHATQLKYAQVDSISFDFTGNFTKVKPIFEESDVVMGNLETVVAGKEKGYLGYPVFNTPFEYLTALENAGFDLLITANNHSTDQGKEGIINTAMNIKKSNMEYSGTNILREDMHSINVYSVNDISFTVLSYTFAINLHNLNDDDLYMVNFIDTVRIREDIKQAREENAEIIILFFHFGKEYSNEPNQYQKEIVSRSIEYGADIILGSHPHTLQPIEFFQTSNASIDTGFVAYSLGNFISNQRWRYSDCGTILNFELEKNINTNKIKLTSVDFIPIWVFKGNNGEKEVFEVLPASTYNFNGSLDYLSEDDVYLIQESLEDTREIINKYSDRSKERIYFSDKNQKVYEDSTLKN